MPVESNIYIPLWEKYRPVILQLMKGNNKPVEYKLSSHEFKMIGNRDNSGYTFSLEVFKGKAVNNIGGSAVARDLLLVLKQSKTATELMNDAAYILRLDKDFILHVSKK